MQKEKWWKRVWSDWKAEPWFYVFVAIGVGAVVGGAISYMFNWPSIYGAKWWEVMTAFGTVGAVITSLWLADRERRENVQSLVMRQSMAYVGTGGVEVLVISLDIVSNGLVPSNITSVSIHSKHSRMKYQQVQYLFKSSDFPVRLQHGDKVSLLFSEDAGKQISDFIKRYCESKYEGLTLCVNTTLKNFSEDLSIDVLAFIKQQG